MKQQHILNKRRANRVNRTRAKIVGSASRPRLAVFRSNRAIAAQLIDDGRGHTLVAASSRELKTKVKKTDVARQVGELIAKKATAAGITQAVFDRRSYRYHGRVKAVAEGARTGGLKV